MQEQSLTATPSAGGQTPLVLCEPPFLASFLACRKNHSQLPLLLAVRHAPGAAGVPRLVCQRGASEGEAAGKQQGTREGGDVVEGCYRFERKDQKQVTADSEAFLCSSKALLSAVAC